MVRTLLPFILVTSLVACGGDQPTPAPTPADANARIIGDMPVVGTFDSSARVEGAQLNDDFFATTLHATGDHGWAMVAISAMVDPETGDVEDDTATAIGCTGDEEYDAEYDEPAEDIDVDIETVEVDGEEIVNITVDVTFEGESQMHATASIPKAELVDGPTFDF